MIYLKILKSGIQILGTGGLLQNRGVIEMQKLWDLDLAMGKRKYFT